MNGDVPEADSGSDTPVPEIHPDGGWSSLDAVLGVLANQRRRYALYYLQDQTTATLQEVADQVASLETEEGEQTPESVPTDQVYTDFYHRHLPKLVDANLIEYDPREELVRYDCPRQLERVVDIIRWVENPVDGSN